MSKTVVMCDCSHVDRCPQGKIGSMNRCSILRDEAMIEPLDAASRARKERLQNLVDGSHIRCDVLTERVAALETSRAILHQEQYEASQRIGKLEDSLDQADNEIGLLARYLGFSVADGHIVQINGDPIRPSPYSEAMH